MTLTCRIFPLLLLCLFLSCNINDPGDSGSAIVPLAVGNIWHKTRTTYDTLGNVQSAIETPNEVTRDTIIGGTHWYVLAGEGGHLVTNTHQGLMEYEFGSGGSSVLFQYPGNIGDYFDKYPWGRVTIVSTEMFVIVPAGLFKCYVYVWDGDPLGRYVWYLSPKNGFVKEEFCMRMSDNQYHVVFKTELTSVSLR